MELKQSKKLAKVQKEDAVEDASKVMNVTTAKEKLKHVVSKEAFNIDGLGKSYRSFLELKIYKTTF